MKKQVKSMLAVMMVIGGTLLTAGCSIEANADNETKSQNIVEEETPIVTMKVIKVLRGNSRNHLIVQDTETGCMYVETADSLTSYIGADGNAEGCKEIE